MWVVDVGSFVVVVFEEGVLLVVFGWCIDVLEKCFGVKLMYCLMWWLVVSEEGVVFFECCCGLLFEWD